MQLCQSRSKFQGSGLHLVCKHIEFYSCLSSVKISLHFYRGKIKKFIIWFDVIVVWIGSMDGTVRIWEVETGRCLRVWEFGEAVKCVAWNPVRELPILAVSM